MSASLKIVFGHANHPSPVTVTRRYSISHGVGIYALINTPSLAPGAQQAAFYSWSVITNQVSIGGSALVSARYCQTGPGFPRK